MTANEYVKKLKTGWNLGNTMDAYRRNFGNMPFRQETAWGNPPTTRAMLQKIKDAGFDIFRLPVTWYYQTDSELNIKREWLNRVKQIVDFAYDLGMTVIINLHHEDWLFTSDENYPSAKIKIEKVWTQIADYFKEYDDKLIFETMNEPRKEGTDVEWNGGDEEGRRVVMRLNQDAVDAIRATGGNNAARMLMVPNYAASCYEAALQDFVMPKGENLMMSLHGYVPYDFALLDDPGINTWKEEYKTVIDDLFKCIDKHILSKGIPVVMGECGARKKGDNEADRVEWAKYYTAKAREYGIPCIWWDNGLLNGTESTEVFGLLNRQKLEWAFPKIVEAFVGR